jgi:hypothetical protein
MSATSADIERTHVSSTFLVAFKELNHNRNLLSLIASFNFFQHSYSSSSTAVAYTPTNVRPLESLGFDGPGTCDRLLTPASGTRVSANEGDATDRIDP